jgi:hypothetical protein
VAHDLAGLGTWASPPKRIHRTVAVHGAVAFDVNAALLALTVNIGASAI